MMIEASMGEVMFNPRRKSPWLKDTPHKEAIRKNRWSLKGTFSRGTNREAIQKAPVAKRILDKVSPSGEIHTGNKDLESGMFIPKIRVTASMMKCPALLFFGILFVCLTVKKIPVSLSGRRCKNTVISLIEKNSSFESLRGMADGPFLRKSG